MSLVTAAVIAAEQVTARELPVPTWVYGLVALIVFFVLAMVTYSYRDVANRHRAKAAAYAERHGAHGESQHGGH